MATFALEDAPILVEFTPELDAKKALGPSTKPEDALERSARAVDHAMGIIYQMAQRLKETMDALPDKPSEVELEFGLKLDVEAGAVIAKTTGGAAISVRLTWQRPEAPERPIPILPGIPVPPPPAQ